MQKLKSTTGSITKKCLPKVDPSHSPSSRTFAEQFNKISSARSGKVSLLSGDKKFRPVRTEGKKDCPKDLVNSTVTPSTNLNEIPVSISEKLTAPGSEELLSGNSPHEGKKLDRYMFYENEFSLFRYFLETSKEFEEEAEKVGKVEAAQKDKGRASCSPTTMNDSYKSYSKLASNLHAIRSKISKNAASPTQKSNFSPLDFQEFNTDRVYKSKSPEPNWKPLSFAEVESKTCQLSSKDHRAGNHLRLRVNTSPTTEELSEQVLRESLRFRRSPVLEPNSQDYGKFNILFRGIENRSSKKLDPSWYQRMSKTPVGVDANSKSGKGMFLGKDTQLVLNQSKRCHI